MDEFEPLITITGNGDEGKYENRALYPSGRHYFNRKSLRSTEKQIDVRLSVPSVCISLLRLCILRGPRFVS